jgi:hypothetical protein
VLSIPPAFNLSHDQTLQFCPNHVCAPFEMGRESFFAGNRQQPHQAGPHPGV